MSPSNRMLTIGRDDHCATGAERAGFRNSRLAIVRLATPYIEFQRLIERLHHKLLGVIADALHREGAPAVNAVQALMLDRIGEQELRAGDLLRGGYFLGSSASYNIKVLFNGGFLEDCQAPDRRTRKIRVTDKGREVQRLVAATYEQQLRAAIDAAAPAGELASLNERLARLDYMIKGLVF